MPETTTHNGRAALVTEPKVKLRFYVPMGLPESNPVCDHVEAVLADEFGGYTETVEDAHGGWKHPDTGRIVEDEITLNAGPGKSVTASVRWRWLEEGSL